MRLDRIVQAVEAQARALGRRRGVVLPDAMEAFDLVIDLLPRESLRALADAVQEEQSLEPVLRAVNALPIAPSQAALRGAVLAAVEAVLGGDAAGYRVALRRVLVGFSTGAQGWEGVKAAAEHLARPPAPPPPVRIARSEPTAEEQASIESARRAVRPEPAPAATPAGVGEQVVAAVESLGDAPAGEEVEVVVRRRLPGEGPYYPEGVPRHSDTQGWELLGPGGLFDWEGWNRR